MKKAIIGFGGFAREVAASISSCEDFEISTFFVDDDYYNGEQQTKKLSDFDPNIYEVIIAVGDPFVRKKIVDKLPHDTKFFNHVHKSVIILGKDLYIGEGSIICAGTILTTNISIGKHSHLNLQTTIGHDCKIGDFLTTSPGTKISGNCSIGNRVYFGTNSSVKEKITIVDDTVFGLNSGIVHNIKESGVYVGTPVKKIK